MFYLLLMYVYLYAIDYCLHELNINKGFLVLNLYAIVNAYFWVYVVFKSFRVHFTVIFRKGKLRNVTGFVHER